MRIAIFRPSGQLFTQYLLNGEQRHVFAAFLVRWKDGKLTTRRDGLYTVRFDEHGVPTMAFDRYLY